MKKLVLVFVFMMLLTSCSSGSATETNIITSADSNDTASETETDQQIEIMDFNGKTFTFYTRYYTDGWDWNVDDLYVENENGEPVNDAVYRRNSKIMEKYNCIIEQIKSGDMWGYSALQTALLAGDDTYDSVIMPGSAMTVLGRSNLLYDLLKLDNIDPYKSYWNQNLTNVLTIGGKLYYAMGDLSATDNRAVRCLYFNKDLFDNMKLEYPYDLVRSGKWTHDVFFKLVKQGLIDLDGNGAYDEKDCYGLFTQPVIGLNLYYSSGEQFISKDENDLLELAFTTNKAQNIMLTVAQNITDAKDCIVMSNDYQIYQKLFSENHSLFYAEVSLFIERFRLFEFNVGMLPMPKYDEAQENYFQYADGNCTNLVGIPVTNNTPEDTALLLEALSYESSKTLTPAYYEVCLTGKSLRDDESEEMLDYIFNSYTIDYGDFFKFSFMSNFQSVLCGDDNVASTIAGLTEAAKVLIAEVNEQLK